jgi:mitogen-activated protein kinase kinase 1
VALKVVPLNMKEEHTVEFLKKLRELYDSRHPNVTAFHGAAYDVKKSEMVIAFEYMDQRSLKDIVLRTPSRQIPEEIMGCCAGQIVAGLHYLHDQRRIIHRDIKPSNILLNSRGQFKLADFGMSKELHTLDAGHTWVGTSSYMSPERVGGETYSFNADLWSLGVLVLESCTGHSPYEGTTQYDILDRIVDGDPPALPPTFSNQAIDFVHLCTKKLPSERPHAAFFMEHPYVKLNANAPTISWLANLAPDNIPA